MMMLNMHINEQEAAPSVAGCMAAVTWRTVQAQPANSLFIALINSDKLMNLKREKTD